VGWGVVETIEEGDDPLPLLMRISIFYFCMWGIGYVCDTKYILRLLLQNETRS
jgi:hypothetical protein